MKKSFQNMFLLGASVIICILLFEFIIRFYIKPSSKCYGELFHTKLPPFTIDIANKFNSNLSDEPLITVDGKQITFSDLWGEYVVDPVLGYVPKKNAISHNGWWRSNDLGARSSVDISKNIPPGMQRFIVFGESFTNCGAVPDKETWPFFLNNKSKNVEFFNFGVNGYSMGQCLLRYEAIKKAVDYDTVMLVFVPTWDLWRDINVLRQLAEYPPDNPPMPRFIVEHGQLKLIKSPYKTYDDFFLKNKNQLSVQLRQHLEAYDRLYFRAEYESPSLLGDSIIYKLIARSVYIYQNHLLFRNIMTSGSEAMIVSLKIFERMHEEADRDGKKFVLVCLPSREDLRRYNKHQKFQQRYDEFVSLIKEKGIICINLMKDMSEVRSDQLDRSYDNGVHYGPKANKIISEILWYKLKLLKLIK